MYSFIKPITSKLTLSRCFSLLAITSVVVLSGCASDHDHVRYVDPNTQGRIAGTGIESQDINAAAQQAAQSIVNLPQIANVSRPPVIMVTPVTNRSSTPIDTSLYTSELRDTLLANAGGRVRFIERDVSAMNQHEQEMINSGEVVGQGDRGALAYDYILTAEIQGISMASGEGQSDYFRVAFKLKDRRTDELVWSNVYQIKKEGRESAVYR